jgi:hypothetical protein
MISNLDIWRAANLLIQKHGADSELEAAKHADLMLRPRRRRGAASMAADQAGDRGATGSHCGQAELNLVRADLTCDRSDQRDKTACSVAFVAYVAPRRNHEAKAPAKAGTLLRGGDWHRRKRTRSWAGESLLSAKIGAARTSPRAPDPHCQPLLDRSARESRTML